MLDHLLVDLIAAVRRSLDRALLQRQAVEERFQVDVFLGDVSWETSYSLPGEEQPPRVRADLSLDWPTWSQTAYRSWSIGEPPEELPEVVVEVAVRIQRLAERPAVERVLGVLPAETTALGAEPLVRTSTTVEEVYGDDGTGADEPAPAGGATATARWAVEATYEGSVRFDEGHLEDPSTVEPIVDSLTRWISSTLVQLADLPLSYLPPDPPGGRDVRDRHEPPEGR
ncbi:MAG: hypothetical protein ACRDZR_07540 [Acidimicrobiales bacterium]